MTEGFRAIKVVPHREPDVVIRAGAWPAEGDPTQGDGATDAGPTLVPAAPCAGEAPGAAAAAPEASAPPSDARARAASDAPREDAFHETTLEDIETSRMGALQKGIIVVAVLALIACVVWYALFMS